MNLIRLSLVRVTKGVPRVLTNEQRARLLRAALPAPTYNEHIWPHCQGKEYERQETLDGRYESTDAHWSSK